MGGDAQAGPLKVMYDGRRIDASYDPMRKQGAIVLGNGGDNSNDSQGTFYEGAMTAAGTFPSDATDQLVQANVVAARYGAAPLAIAPASAPDAPTGVQTFSPGSSRSVAVTFTNTTRAPVTGLRLAMALPDGGWRATLAGQQGSTHMVKGPVAPGQTVRAVFRVTSGMAAANGDLRATAQWDGAQGARGAMATQRYRNVAPIVVDAVRFDGADEGYTRLRNTGAAAVDISGWTLSHRASGHARFAPAIVPDRTVVRPGGTYLLGHAGSSLAVPAGAGADVIRVAGSRGWRVGDMVELDSGAATERRRIAAAGSAAGPVTTLWQPLPDGPVITVPAGSRNIPVTSTRGFRVGDQVALGHGARYPVTGDDIERYEVATVAAVGTPGAQEYLLADAAAGDTVLQVSGTDSMAVGERIRLDIASMGHGIETVTVKRIGTAAAQLNLAADAAAGATRIKVRGRTALRPGDRIVVGNPVSREAVTVASVTPGEGRGQASVEIRPALARAHDAAEWVVRPGTGVEIARPLRYAHAQNLPFSVRGSGIGLAAPTRHAHSSNEPVLPLGAGFRLDRPLGRAHAQDAAIRQIAAGGGWPGAGGPGQWIGGVSTRGGGSVILRDARGLVVDAVNHGLLVDHWAAEGYHGMSGTTNGGCFVGGPKAPGNQSATPNVSFARRGSGRDTDSNCDDFTVTPAAAKRP